MPKKKNQKKRFSFTNKKVFSQKLTIGIFVLIFGLVGAYVLKKPFALDQNKVPTAASQLILQVADGHEFAIAPEVMEGYDPPSVLLYGDGLLLCGGTVTNKKQLYTLNAGRLTRNQITDLVNQISDAGALTDAAYKQTKEVAQTRAVGSITDVLVNYTAGAVSLKSSHDKRPTAAIAAELAINNACMKYAKTPYQPAEYSVKTKAVDPSSTEGISPLLTSLFTLNSDGGELNIGVSVDGVTKAVSSLTGIDLQKYSVGVTINTSGEFAETKLTADRATKLLATLGGAKNAKVDSNGRTYQLMVTPILPEHQPIIPVERQEAGTVSAASDYRTQFAWFTPKGVSASSTSSETQKIADQARDFYKLRTGRTMSTIAPKYIQGENTVAWYNECHTFIPCSTQKDLNAIYNVEYELRKRGLVQPGVSLNLLAQWPSQWGPTFCSGWGFGSGAGAAGVLSITTGFGSTTRGCQNGTWVARYIIPAHELGHTFGLPHCTNPGPRLMCGSGDYPWQSGIYVTDTAAAANLQINSPFLNHKVSGRVFYQKDNKPLANATVSTCRSDVQAVTDTNGNYSFALPTGASYCLKITAPSGYTITTRSNPENATAQSYEYQKAGVNCYNQPTTTTCPAETKLLDMPTDANKDFILVKPASTTNSCFLIFCS